MEIILKTYLVIIFLAMAYCIYQFIRNEATYRMVKKWINEHDERYYLYDYDFIMQPNKKNWFGLKLPNEKDYQ